LLCTTAIIAGTQGRGIWILDDLEPLREITRKISEEQVHLFSPAQTWRLRNDENRDTPWPPSTPLGQNPPTGAIIDYWLKDNAQGQVTLTISDSIGNIVKQFSSDEKVKKLPVHRYFEKGWLAKAKLLYATAGMHRFVWDLRYPRPSALQYRYSIAAVRTDGTPVVPEGPLVLPGHYTVSLKVSGKKYTRPLVIKLDPRVHVSNNDLVKQLKLARQIDALLNKSVAAYKNINNLLMKKGGLSAAMADSLSTLTSAGQPNLSSAIGALSSLVTSVQRADAAPVQGQTEVFSYYKKQIDGLLTRWHRLDKK